MTDIVWEDPPPQASNLAAGHRNRRWAHRLAPLRERPGQWANLGEHNCGRVTEINHGHVAGVEPGEFQAVMRTIDQETGRGTLFVRFVGGPSSEGMP